MKLWKLALLLAEGVFSLAIAGGYETTETRTGTMIAALNDTLIVRACDEQLPHTERLGLTSTITRDGLPVQLVDLRAGDRLTTTTGEDGCVTLVAAESSDAVQSEGGTPAVVAAVVGSRIDAN